MTASVLSTQTTMNPMRPRSATFYDTRQKAYILSSADRRRLRVLTSFGPAGWMLGDTHECYDDATDAYMGMWTVVGTVHFKSGVQVGEVPDRELPHWVMK